MIFDQDDLQGILAGKTTTTRLPIRKRAHMNAIMGCPVKAGRSYPLRLSIPATEDAPAEIKTTAQWLKVLNVERDNDEWVVTFERGKIGTTRLLSATKRAIDSHEETDDPAKRLELEQGDDARGYTSRTSKALRDAGECVDDRSLDRYAIDNEHRFNSTRRTTREEAAAERFERARAQARAKGLDTSGAVAVVERQAKALERAAERAA